MMSKIEGTFRTNNQITRITEFMRKMMKSVMLPEVSVQSMCIENETFNHGFSKISQSSKTK